MFQRHLSTESVNTFPTVCCPLSEPGSKEALVCRKRSASYALTLALASLLCLPLPVMSADPDKRPQFGSPNQVENQIADDARPAKALVEKRILERWFDWKADLQERTGFSFGLDYTGLYLGADNSLGKNHASSGMIRAFGAWDLVGRGTKSTGALVWKVEHRHKYSDVAPNGFGLSQLGYVGVLGGPFSDQGTRLTNLYWRQGFNDGKTQLTGGYLDATDYVDVFIAGPPWTGFTNLAFSVGSASMFTPNDATVGIAGASMLTDNLYAIAGITNALADPTDPFKDSFDRFFSDGEHFKSLEIGWTTSSERVYLDNTHLTYWHVDDSVQADTIGGWGLAFSHISYVNDQWMPFVRGGYANDGGSLLQKSLSVGFLYQKDPTGDLFGLGLNWGQPNETTFTPGLDDQYTMEAFYRFQFTQQFAITPSVEYLKNPALNPGHNSIWVFGLRARLAL